MSIEVEHLTKKYGSQIAVNDVSFSIPSGQVVGFLGPNGAGKSTTMKMLTSFVAPTSGTARVAGFDINEDSLSVRSQIGYLPEHNPLYDDMYIKEYLLFVARLCNLGKDSAARVDHLIELTGLTREKHKKISALSKGYRQRVGMAQALMKDPQVLILDEPTSGLDPNQILEIRKLIREIGEDRTVLLSTHIMQEVEAMCDRVIIINKGQLVADDSLEKLQQESGSGVVKYSVKFKNAVDGSALSKLPSAKGVSAEEDTWIIETTALDSLQEELFAFAVEHKHVILEQKEIETGLEDIFRSLTQRND